MLRSGRTKPKYNQDTNVIKKKPLPADNLIKYKKKHTPKNNILFDNDFEIESKYHRKYCCLVVLVHILSSQDVIFRSMFFLTNVIFW